MVRSEKLIEFGNSWFFPKQLWGWRLQPKYRGRALNRVPWSFSRSSNQTPNTESNYQAVRLWALRSIGRKGNSPDLYLRSLNLC